jgi:predicted O-linked N-acetylglucosamine transferase (SPINDLY family)
MSPQLAQLLQKAVHDIQANDLASAKLLLNEVLKTEKKQPDALRFMGVIAALQREWQQALEWVDLALEVSPQNGIAHSNRGNILIELGRHLEALSCYQQATALEPGYAEAYSNQGNALQALGRYQEALASYEKAVQLDPNYAQAFYGVACLFCLRNQFANALGCCDQALRINPGYEAAQELRGKIFFQVKDYQNALDAYDKVLLLNPKSSDAWICKGHIYAEMKDFLGARTAFLEALAIKPDSEFLLGTMIQNDLQMCRWDCLDQDIKKLIKEIESGKKAATPYNLISLLDDRILIKRSIEIFAKALQGDIQREQQKMIAVKKKIRLGYFSADFHDHPTAHLIAELFECHDKEQFELIAFVFGRNTPDAMRSRLEHAFDQFIDLNGMTDEEAAKLSRDMQIDIAIDLKGLTEEGRPKIFMHGAAPIQISYLAFPGTMGHPCFDYVIADRVIIPEEYQDGMAEKIIYMPNSYQVNDRSRRISTVIKTREELGLPPSGFVFCCFNNNYKIMPSVMDGWVRIIDSVKDSVLWLYEDNPYAVENLRREAIKRGLDANRIVFAGRMDLPNHLARYREADLFLDTTPCNAHTTASDALWAGLPVLTLIGESFGARVAASLLHSIGLPELVVNTQEEYEKLAIELANNPPMLQEIKSRLEKNLQIKPLFDTPLFTKHLESAYRQAYQRNQENLISDHIYVN